MRKLSLLAWNQIHRPTLIIFDCDEVLVDSEILGARVHAAAFAALRQEISAADLLHRFTGIPDAEMYVVLELPHWSVRGAGSVVAVSAAPARRSPA